MLFLREKRLFTKHVELYSCTVYAAGKLRKSKVKEVGYAFKTEEMCMTIRQRLEEQERQNLSEFACLSSQSRGREKSVTQDDMRTEFQRDRDRILHCKSFRRLKGKTQVFLSPQGDHYRTRLTHTLEVSQIARTISRALRLNEDLTEANKTVMYNSRIAQEYWKHFSEMADQFGIRNDITVSSLSRFPDVFSMEEEPAAYIFSVLCGSALRAD